MIVYKLDTHKAEKVAKTTFTIAELYDHSLNVHSLVKVIV